MASADDELIAFLAVRTDDETGHFVGAVLVTDAAGVPKEFRCTDAIRPTPIQRTLYGKSLETHVYVDLCGKPLLKALATQPKVVLVKSQLLLDVGQHVPCPVLHVELDVGRVREVLRTWFAGVTLLEPFDRIDAALTTLAEQEERYR